MSQRANRFSRTRDYLARADEDICLLIQIETEEALSEVDSSPGSTASTACSSIPRISPPAGDIWEYR